MLDAAELWTEVTLNGRKIGHSLRVSEMLENLGQSDKVITAGMLHDIVEDSDVSLHEIENNFGAKVAELVKELTILDSDLLGYSSKTELLKVKMPKMSEEALLIKLCDRLDNILSKPFDAKYYKRTIDLLRTVKKKRNLSKKAKSILNETIRVCNNRLKLKS